MKILSTLLFLFTLNTVSATAAAEDLLEVYDLATQSDSQLGAAAADRDARLEVQPQAMARMRPTINLSADSTYNTQTSTQQTIFSTGNSKKQFNSNTYTVTLTQPLFRYDYLMQIYLADSAVAQAQADYLNAEQTLALRVAEAYFNVLAAADDLEFAQAEKNAIGRQLEQVKRSFEVGLIAITDVQEAQAAFDLALATEINAENQLESQREGLRVITGERHDNLVPLKTEIPMLRPDPEDDAIWVENALRNNPAVLSALFAQQVARRNVKIARAGHYPTLDVVATNSTADINAGISGARQTGTDAVGLQLNVPIFSGGLVSSRTRENQHRLTQTSENLDLQRRTVTRRATDAHRSIIADISRIKALKQAVVSTESALEATEVGFEVGTRTIVDVLINQRDVFRAKRDYARARYEYLLRTLQLKQAAGILDRDSLAQINEWLAMAEAEAAPATE